MVACTPTLDWRELRPEGAGVAFALPCKPSVFARKVSLQQSLVEMTLHACSAGGVTWAVAHADVGDPGRVTPALKELRESATSNLSALASTATPVAIPGATPNPEAGRSVLTGKLPDGRKVSEVLMVFAIGTKVYQATAVGETMPVEAVETFASSLRALP